MIARPSDEPRSLTEAQVCEIAGTSQQRRQLWVKRGLLKKVGRTGCALGDALELVQLKALVDVLGPTDGCVAWLQVRMELERTSSVDPLDVLFDAQIKEARVTDAECDLRPMVDHGRPVRLVALADLRKQTEEAFRRLGDVATSTAVSSTRKARR
jgi:hypothetical protein